MKPQDPNSRSETVNLKGNADQPRAVLCNHSDRIEHDCVYHLLVAQEEKLIFGQNTSNTIIIMGICQLAHRTKSLFRRSESNWELLANRLICEYKENQNRQTEVVAVAGEMSQADSKAFVVRFLENQFLNSPGKGQVIRDLFKYFEVYPKMEK